MLGSDIHFASQSKTFSGKFPPTLKLNEHGMGKHTCTKTILNEPHPRIPAKQQQQFIQRPPTTPISFSWLCAIEPFT